MAKQQCLVNGAETSPCVLLILQPRGRCTKPVRSTNGEALVMKFHELVARCLEGKPRPEAGAWDWSSVTVFRGSHVSPLPSQLGLPLILAGSGRRYSCFPALVND